MDLELMLLSRLFTATVLALVLFLPGAGAQKLEPQEDQEEGFFAADPAAEPKLRLGLEAKAHFRQSQGRALPSPFPLPPDRLPVGQDTILLETVNEGSHLEASALTVLFDYRFSPRVMAHAKVDVFGLYERNPTSEDDSVDVDEAWVRFGREVEPGSLPDGSGAYLKIGKFGHFERQDDRHLESYGLVSTAFNRLEDLGLELGLDLGRHFYLKVSATQGNPLFFRDPNALAGDNGIPLLLSPLPNPDPELKSGFPIFYDAEVEGLDADGDLELGVGLGLRFGDAAGHTAVDLQAWGYERKLADTVQLKGTFYGGDLDLILGPFNSTPLPISGNEKREVGANLWLYRGTFSLFGQYVFQDLAGLDRSGYEGEVAWAIHLPLKWAIGGRQLFPYVAPAVRFSVLRPDFVLHPLYVAPSVGWDWDKLDVGIRLGILDGLDLTVEWTENTFVVQGRDVTLAEGLTTLRWQL